MRLKPPMRETPLADYLVALLFAFQLKLAERFKDAVVEGIEQAGRLQVVDPWQVAAGGEPEKGQELGCRPIEQRPTGALPAPGRPNPTRIHQHVERALRDLDAADCFDFGAAHRLVIGNDRERLRRRARQAPGLLARSPQKVREVWRGLEMPAPAALHELDAAPFVMLGELPKRDFDLAFADVLGQLLDAERLGRGEQGCLESADQLVHHAATLRWMGANGPSWAISSRPRRASSSAARKLEANAERRNCGSCVTGRKLSRTVQSRAMPIILPTRSIASSSVITDRAWTTCSAGCVRARTTP